MDQSLILTSEERMCERDEKGYNWYLRFKNEDWGVLIKKGMQLVRLCKKSKLILDTCQ